MQPTKLTLLDPKTIIPGVFKEVTSTDAFEGMTQNLNDEGLYSLEIFGKMGSKERDRTEAFINTKLDLFNPTYLKSLIQIKSLYQGIIKGTEYATWDEDTQDFIKSNLLDGETGFSFFMTHFEKLKPKLTESYKREKRVTLVTEFRDIALTDKVLVTPAGIRDIQFQPNGAPTEPEVTDLYRKLIFRTRVVSLASKRDANNPLYDNVRWGLQSAFNDIDQHYFGLSEGKGGLLQRRLSTRGVVSGTRNVITARKVSRANLFKSNGVNPNSADMGLYQSVLNYQYVCLNAMLNGYTSSVFTPGSQSAKLVNKKTLGYEYVELLPSTVEKWTTVTGISKLFNGFGNAHVRNKVIVINDHYLMLVYDDGTDVMVLYDINDLPEHLDRKHVKPITYAELYYLSCQKVISEQISQQTRYPITGIGSIIPVTVNLKTTNSAGERNIRDLDWNIIETCLSYPESGTKEAPPDYFDAMSVDPSRENGFGSDHDFFMTSKNVTTVSNYM